MDYEHYRLFRLTGSLADAVRTYHEREEQIRQDRAAAIEELREFVGASRVITATNYPYPVIGFNFPTAPSRSVWRKAEYVSNAWFPKRTQEASLILSLLESLPKLPHRGQDIAELWDAFPNDHKPERSSAYFPDFLPGGGIKGLALTYYVNGEAFVAVTRQSNWEKPAIDEIEEVPGWHLERARWAEAQATG